jgi:hypothetical protein
VQHGFITLTMSCSVAAPDVLFAFVLVDFNDVPMICHITMTNEQLRCAIQIVKAANIRHFENCALLQSVVFLLKVDLSVHRMSHGSCETL